MTGTSEPGKSAADLFNEKPSWYDEPELSDAQLNPDYVPPRRDRLGDTAGMASLPTRKPSNVGLRAELTWVFIIFVAFGGLALFAVFSGVFSEERIGSEVDPRELAVDDCFIAGGVIDPSAIPESNAPVDVVSCNEPHNAQVVGVLPLPNELTSENLNELERVLAECAETFRRVDESLVPNDGVPQWIGPSGSEWETGRPDGNFVCYIYSQTGLTGSVTN